MQSIRSPITKSIDVSFLHEISSEELVRDWSETFQVDIAEEMAGCEAVRLYQCNQTQLKFYSPLEVAGSDKLYEQLQKFDWFYTQNKWEYQVALKDINDCKKILEVGSGFGYFIERAIKLSLAIQGLELNSSAVKIAQGNGLPVSNIDLSEFSGLYPSSQDAVCSFQVLEHIPQPMEFIENCILALKSGGKLIFCVPNSESFLKYQYNLLDMPPHHMTKWSEETFKSLERFFPIQLETVKFEPLASYHVSSFLIANADYLRKQSKAYRFAFNRITMPVYKILLNLGIKHFFRGQSLYVSFRKL